MAEDRSDPTDEVPEADRLEQSAAVAPSADEDESEPVDAMGGAAVTEADPADRQEQLIPVEEDDEDYPRA
jgi:hypothetical protein